MTSERFSGENEVSGQVNKEGISSGVHTPGNSNGGKGDARLLTLAEENVALDEVRGENLRIVIEHMTRKFCEVNGMPQPRRAS